MSSHGPTGTTAALQSARKSLQNRQFDEALDTLQQALVSDPSSRELYELLGITYAQKGMVSEAIQALTSAVTLNPSNITSRINLAVALQRAGHLPETAVQLQEALKIDPANEKARKLLQSLQTPREETPQVVSSANPPTASSQPTSGYAPPLSQPLHPPQPLNPLQGRYGQSYPYGAPPPDYTSQGYGPRPYETEYSRVVPDDPEGWSPTNIGPILTSPKEFFQQQRGQQGLLQPLGYVSICFLVFFVLESLAGIGMVAGKEGIVGYGKYLGLFLFVPLGAVLNLVFEFVLSGIFHLFCRMFGGKARYPGTLRAHCYAMTPFYLLGAVGALILWAAPGEMAKGAGQLGGFVFLVGIIWTFALLVFGFREIHTISEGRAIGAAIMPAGIMAAFLVVYWSLTM